MILLIDNYDSFTYNLVQRLGEIDPSLDIEVHRNDQISCDEIEGKQPSHLIVSPGPCTPSEAGISVECIQRFMGKLPILGVCLGHQSIGQATGGVIVRAKRLMHGKTDRIEHDGRGIFRGLPIAADGDAVSQPGHSPGYAVARFRRQRLGRCARRHQRDHGHPPQAAARRRRTVPSRELFDRTRACDAAGLFGDVMLGSDRAAAFACQAGLVPSIPYCGSVLEAANVER